LPAQRAGGGSGGGLTEHRRKRHVNCIRYVRTTRTITSKTQHGHQGGHSEHKQKKIKKKKIAGAPRPQPWFDMQNVFPGTFAESPTSTTHGMFSMRQAHALHHRDQSHLPVTVNAGRDKASRPESPVDATPGTHGVRTSIRIVKGFPGPIFMRIKLTDGTAIIIKKNNKNPNKKNKQNRKLPGVVGHTSSQSSFIIF